AISALALPLSARDRTLGVLLLAMESPARSFTPAVVSLADELAGRAGIALDNALLVRGIQEHDRRRNEFLAMLAHEPPNPLAPIRNALEIMRLVGADTSDMGLAQDVIQRQLAHMVRMVDDLLDASRITRGKISLQTRPVNIADVVAQAIEVS